MVQYNSVVSDESDVGFRMRGVNLSEISRARFLGIIIDDNLNFHDQAKFILTKPNRNKRKLYKTKPYLSKASVKFLYMLLGWSKIV